MDTSDIFEKNSVKKFKKLTNFALRKDLFPITLYM